MVLKKKKTSDERISKDIPLTYDEMVKINKKIFIDEEGFDDVEFPHLGNRTLDFQKNHHRTKKEDK